MYCKGIDFAGTKFKYFGGFLKILSHYNTKNTKPVYFVGV